MQSSNRVFSGRFHVIRLERTKKSRGEFKNNGDGNKTRPTFSVFLTDQQSQATTRIHFLARSSLICCLGNLPVAGLWDHKLYRYLIAIHSLTSFQMLQIHNAPESPYPTSFVSKTANFCPKVWRKMVKKLRYHRCHRCHCRCQEKKQQ